MSDLISRQAAIDLVKSFYKIDKSVLKIMVFKLKQLPSVQPRRGKWIDDGTEFGCCCSECNYTLDDYFYGELREVALTKLMNFCPNCGAELR